jgi:hypothetical protein
VPFFKPRQQCTACSFELNEPNENNENNENNEKKSFLIVSRVVRLKTPRKTL